MIIGTQNSKIVYNETEIDLPYSVLVPTFFISDETEHTSVISGVKTYSAGSDYAEFKVRINLWKYEYPKVKYEEIMNAYKSNVIFFPHKNGDSIKDRYGNDAQFIFNKIEKYFLNNRYFYDILFLWFKSDKYINYSGVYVDRTIVDDKDRPLIDDKDRELWDDL